MPHYTDTPPEPDHRFNLPLRRTPTTGHITAIATTAHLLGTNTHFWGGRTVPCEDPDCEPCRQGIPFRWHAYLGAILTATLEQIIFEVTSHGVDPFIAYRATYGTLRGCLFEAHRQGSCANGRVIIRCRPADLAKLPLPAEPDLVAILAKIWNLPTTALDAPVHSDGVADVQLNPAPVHRMRDILNEGRRPHENGRKKTL
jgi:hypothetical protein